MEKLNYGRLDELVRRSNASFEITNVDVKRLRDDRSEIQAGQDVAFVATASFRLPKEMVQPLKDMLRIELSGSDELFVIGSDAELRANKVPIDEDGVSLWIYDHYRFRFLLNGVEHGFSELGRVLLPSLEEQKRSEVALPWVTKLSTAAVKDDYFDVDVLITAKMPSSPSGKSVLRPVRVGQLELGGRWLAIELAADLDRGSDPTNLLMNRKFRLVQCGDDDALGEVLVLRFTDGTAAPPSGGSSSAAMTKDAKQKP